MGLDLSKDGSVTEMWELLESGGIGSGGEQ